MAFTRAAVGLAVILGRVCAFRLALGQSLQLCGLCRFTSLRGFGGLARPIGFGGFALLLGARGLGLRRLARLFGFGRPALEFDLRRLGFSFLPRLGGLCQLAQLLDSCGLGAGSFAQCLGDRRSLLLLCHSASCFGALGLGRQAGFLFRLLPCRLGLCRRRLLRGLGLGSESRLLGFRRAPRRLRVGHPARHLHGRLLRGVCLGRQARLLFFGRPPGGIGRRCTAGLLLVSRLAGRLGCCRTAPLLFVNRGPASCFDACRPPRRFGTARFLVRHLTRRLGHCREPRQFVFGRPAGGLGDGGQARLLGVRGSPHHLGFRRDPRVLRLRREALLLLFRGEASRLSFLTGLRFGSRQVIFLGKTGCLGFGRKSRKFRFRRPALSDGSGGSRLGRFAHFLGFGRSALHRGDLDLALELDLRLLALLLAFEATPQLPDHRAGPVDLGGLVVGSTRLLLLGDATIFLGTRLGLRGARRPLGFRCPPRLFGLGSFRVGGLARALCFQRLALFDGDGGFTIGLRLRQSALLFGPGAAAQLADHRAGNFALRFRAVRGGRRCLGSALRGRTIGCVSVV